MEHGVAQRIDGKNFFQYTEILKKQQNFISFNAILPVLTIWASGVIASIVIVLIEIVVFNYTNCIFCVNKKTKLNCFIVQKSMMKQL